MAGKSTKKVVEEENENQETVSVEPLNLQDYKNMVAIMDTVFSRMASKTPEPLVKPSEYIAIGRVRERYIQAILSEDPNWLKPTQPQPQPQEQPAEAETVSS